MDWCIWIFLSNFKWKRYLFQGISFKSLTNFYISISAFADKYATIKMKIFPIPVETFILQYIENVCRAKIFSIDNHLYKIKKK